MGNYTVPSATQSEIAVGMQDIWCCSLTTPFSPRSPQDEVSSKTYDIQMHSSNRLILQVIVRFVVCVFLKTSDFDPNSLLV